MSCIPGGEKEFVKEDTMNTVPMKIVRGIAFLFVVLGLPALSWGIGFEVAVGGWYQDPSGTLAFKPLSPNDFLDVEDDLGYDEEFDVFGRVKLDIPFIPTIYAVATPMKFDGDGAKTFKFGDTVFSGNFSSELKLNQYDIALYYGLPFLETATAGIFNIDLGLDVKIIDFSVEVEGGGIREEESFTLPAPLVYVGVQLRPLDYLAFEAEGRGLAYSGDHFYDLIGRVKVKPFGPFFIAGGYRYQDLDFDEDDVIVDVDIGGPLVEAGLEF
jgi:outer membrane protein